MSAGRVDFMIVGTPRSGTTLVQRLASALPGVQVPPETHFLRLLAPALARPGAFPLGRTELDSALRALGRLETARGLPLDADAVAEALGGRCDTLLELFAAIVRHLTPGAAVRGEKTPSHLIWWRAVTGAWPDLRIVAVVRDPRAVVASYFEAWGRRPHAVIAARWALDQLEVLQAKAALGDRRCLVLRYEDVVADADGCARSLGRFLGVSEDRQDAARQGGLEAPLSLPWEVWKRRAADPVTTARVDAWRGVLADSEARAVATVAARAMVPFGYGVGPESRIDAVRLLRGLRAVDHWGRCRYRLRRHAQRTAIARIARDPGFA